MLETQKVLGLMNRVYSNKMEFDVEKGLDDEKAIKSLCNQVFGDGSMTPDPSMLHQFNNIVVQVANEVAKPMLKQILDPLSLYQTKPANTMVTQYTIPQTSKARLVWSATGSGVDVKRVQTGKKVFIQPVEFSTGFYYEPLTKAESVVEDFTKLVDDLADAKVRLFFKEMTKMTTNAVSTSKIPTGNQLTGSNLTLANYNKLASRIARRGGRPIFIGDTLLIDFFAQQQGNTTNKDLLTDKVRDELREALCPTMIGRTVAMNLVNPFTDVAGTKTELPVNVGYMLGSDATNKPFIIDEIGGMTQITEQNSQDGRIKMMVKQQVGMDLIFGELLGYVKEDAGVAL